MKNAFNGNGLRREIGLFSATVLVIANMMGTGIFTTSGFILAEVRDPRILMFCWLCGGLFALCGALCYGELGARFPRAGGEYVFLKESFGKPVGFLSGWISLIVGFSAPIAAASIAFATYAFKALQIPAGEATVISLMGTPMVTISPLNLAAIGAIGVFTAIHYHSLRMGSRILRVGPGRHAMLAQSAYNPYKRVSLARANPEKDHTGLSREQALKSEESCPKHQRLFLVPPSGGRGRQRACCLRVHSSPGDSFGRRASAKDCLAAHPANTWR